jgi:hypothetical protein
MHFEFLIEDQSGARAMSILLPKLLGDKSSYRIIKGYKGLGHIPKDLRPKSEAKKRILLDRLPRLLRGYGKSLPSCFNNMLTQLRNITVKTM